MRWGNDDQRCIRPIYRPATASQCFRSRSSRDVGSKRNRICIRSEGGINMSAFENYLALRAVEQERAISKASRRHIHISHRPLILLGYHLAGDVGAPLALMWGT